MAGTVLITADGIVGVSGGPVRVYSATALSSGGGACVVKMRNGTAVTDTIYDQIDGTTSKAVIRDYGIKGLLFPAGCYCDVDANTTSVAVVYENGAF